jgi:UDP-N-acetylglucosamine 2-epimerase (non-hydrolysing)
MRQNFEVKVCVTGQHRQLLDQVLELFRIVPDFNLNLMKPNQNLVYLTREVLSGVTRILQKEKYDWVLVQGDTTTTMAGAMAAFYQKIPIGHVEAGLRTFDLEAPFPEELNRQITSKMTTLHFAPTAKSCQNLLNEGFPKETVHITGNTVIDALQWVLKNAPEPKEYLKFADTQQRMILVTGHRRENFGDGFIQICKALKKIAQQFPDTQIVYPVHLNPNVQKPVNRILSEIDNVHLLKPLGYPEFIHLMNKAYLILTDSGGVQEEAPSLGKPVLVMRETTERPEAVEAGTVKLVGANSENIFEETQKLLSDPSEFQAMSMAHNPYGDGTACEKIAKCVLDHM